MKEALSVSFLWIIVMICTNRNSFHIFEYGRIFLDIFWYPEVHKWSFYLSPMINDEWEKLSKNEREKREYQKREKYKSRLYFISFDMVKLSWRKNVINFVSKDNHSLGSNHQRGARLLSLVRLSSILTYAGRTEFYWFEFKFCKLKNGLNQRRSMILRSDNFIWSEIFRFNWNDLYYYWYFKVIISIIRLSMNLRIRTSVPYMSSSFDWNISLSMSSKNFPNSRTYR